MEGTCTCFIKVLSANSPPFSLIYYYLFKISFLIYTCLSENILNYVYLIYSLFFRYPYSGGSYGGYGSGYGAYSSGYGAYNNNNTYNTFLTEINNLPAIQSLQSVVHTAGSVSVMLESCYSAVLASFQAMVGVADQFSKVLFDFELSLTLWCTFYSLSGFQC